MKIKRNDLRDLINDAYKKGTKKDLHLDKPSSHGGWPEGEYEPSVNDQIVKWLKDMGLMVEQKINEARNTDNGDCYESAGKYMMDLCTLASDHCDLILVHGEVTGQGRLEGIKYGHAWVEKGDLVIDKSNGRDIEMPKFLYYQLGRIGEIEVDMSNWGQPGFSSSNAATIKGGNIHRYSWEEARQKILEYKHWGPWELKTETGL